MKIIKENKLYYFTALNDKQQYQTIFVGWLRVDLIKAFEAVDGVSSYANIKMTVGENTFTAHVGAPLYLLDYENDEIFNYAGDSGELNLFPSGNIPPDLDMSPIIDFPSYFKKGVEPLIEFKLFNKFWAQLDGAWVPLDMNNN
jgi:hypothetical protein